MWDPARRMRELWNALVRLYKDAHFAIETLPDADFRQISAQADQAARRLVGQSGLNWECGPEVLDRFRAARTKSLRAIHRGGPRLRAESRVLKTHLRASRSPIALHKVVSLLSAFSPSAPSVSV
jgi:hypothetical protein